MHISTKCSVAIHCLLFIYEYGEKTRVTSQLLSCSTGISAVTIRNIMSALKKDGIISVKNGTGGATNVLSAGGNKPLSHVCCTGTGLLHKLIGVHPMPSQLCPIGKSIHAVLDNSYEKIRNDLKKSLETITLKQIISDYNDISNDISPE